MKIYDRGDQRVFTVEVHDDDGALADPTALVLRVKKPDGSSTSYTWPAGTVTRSGVGLFEQAVDFDLDGGWHIRWEATGAVVAADEDSFHVKRGGFAVAP